MNEPETFSEYIVLLPRGVRILIGVFLLPLACLVLIMSVRELLTRNAKTFQDVAGQTIVYTLSILGPGLTVALPRFRPIHWVPLTLAAILQFYFIAIGKPVSEWWLIGTIAPFTVGTPLVSLLLFKLWFAPRFGLASPSRQEPSC